jgi:RNA polymerase sigma-70 factor (ECF subfamily)
LIIVNLPKKLRETVSVDGNGAAARVVRCRSTEVCVGSTKATTDGAAPVQDRSALEEQVLACCRDADFERAATTLIKGYGPELFGFILALHGNHDEAGDVFSVLCENLWRGLPRFEQRSSLRTWAYTLARHALYKHFRNEGRRRRRVEPLSGSAIARVEQQVRTSTLKFLRSQTRNRLVEWRETLPMEDRGLEWIEIATVMAEGELDAASVKRSAVRLRKRYQLLKDRLREMAAKEGLLESGE